MVKKFSRRNFIKSTALTIGGMAVADVASATQQPAQTEPQRSPSPGQQERGIHLRTVGIMSPGDMGSAVGQALAKQGLTVIAALGERSPRTRALAAAAGIADVGTLEDLVRKADLVMSILVPEAAIAAAQRVAEAIKSTGVAPRYADCNSIAVQSSRKIGAIMKSVGAPFVEASIIGAPPRVPNRTRIYASGPYAHEFNQLNQFGLSVRDLGPEWGRAKAIKICYATVTKGTQALFTGSFISAKRLGVLDLLLTELEGSQKNLLKSVQNGIQSMPPRAHRWVGEMNELAANYQGIGLTPRMLAGAADIYRDVSRTKLGRESPEDQRKLARSFKEFIIMLERDMPRG